MADEPSPEISYKRARFSTRLPTDRLYSPSHFWIAREDGGVCRIGFTKFATRMLGDLVEFGFGAKPGDAVGVGQPVGWVEGFKALSDIYCAVTGEFVGVNPALDEDITLIDTDSYGQGWLYRVRGLPDANAVEAAKYAQLLDELIDGLKDQDAPPPNC